MAHLYKKVKKGHEYYYIRETQRVYGKPTTVNQVYLGTADKVEAALSKGGFSPKEFGSIFILNELDRDLDLAGIVNEILPPKKRTKGPSLGELVFYAAINRAIAPTSKRRLATWYETTDIQRVRPLRLESLNSQNFWNHWDRISDADLEKISTAFFRKVHALPPAYEKHLVIEAANIPSTPKPANMFDLGQMEETELGDLPLSPQVGLALISEMFTGIPVYYQDLPGGLPPTGFYSRYLDNLLAQVANIGVAVKDVTLLFNNATAPEEIVPHLDTREDLHFIACCTPDFAPELTQISLKDFSPLPLKATGQSPRLGRDEDRLLYYETQATFWNRSRRVIVVFDPKTFHQSYQDLGKKVHKVRRELLAATQKCRHEGLKEGVPEFINSQLAKVCQRFKLSPSLFQLGFRQENGHYRLDFQLDHRQMAGNVRHFGKYILITDHEQWSAAEIFEAYANRCFLENHQSDDKGRNISDGNARDFRSPFKAALLPLYHWTDSKIRIHLFVCVVALTYLTLLCQRLKAAGIVTSPQDAMEELRAIKTAIYAQDAEGKLKRVLDTVSDRQAAILAALGYQVQEGKVLPL